MRKYVIIQVRMIAEEVDPIVIKNRISNAFDDYAVSPDGEVIDAGELDIKVEYLPGEVVVNDYGYAIPLPKL